MMSERVLLIEVICVLFALFVKFHNPKTLMRNVFNILFVAAYLAERLRDVLLKGAEWCRSCHD